MLVQPMTEPYYQDDLVTLYPGRCEAVLPTLQLSGSVHLLTDPPYFKVKDEDWDNQWSKQSHFLDWMGEWLDLAKPLLSPDASVWVFASPELTTAVESVVASRFRILNSVRWEKTSALTNKNDHSALRRFLPQWEGIIFAEQLAMASYAPLGHYIRAERERAGITRDEMDVALGFVRTANPKRGTELVRRWEEGSSLPTAESYHRARKVLGKGFLLREYEDMRSEYENNRRPFNLMSRARWTDHFMFESVPGYPGKHPCEKPLGLLTHMIETTTRPGDTILDCFAGSGAVLDAARQLGRRAVGIEMDAHWCKQAARRLSQQTFDLEGIA